MIGIEVRGDVDKLRRIQKLMPILFSRALRDLAYGTQRIMQETSPVRTGRLRQSIRVEKIGPLEYFIGPTVEYAIYVKKGTRPHEIRPRRARALRFVINGKVVFAKKVEHPGTKPNPFVKRTAEIIKTRIGDSIVRQIRTI